MLLHSELVDCLRALDLPHLNSALASVVTILTAAAERPDVQGTGAGATSATVVFRLCGTLTAHLGVLLHQFTGLADLVLTETLGCYRAISKLHYLLVGLFTDLIQKGFCRPAEVEEEQGDHDGEELEGTGMGDGAGSKDVSDQIEDEEQVMGNKGDQNPQDQQDTEMKEEDAGLEMDGDFAGELYDKDKKDEDEKDENEDGEDGDDTQLDQQLGQTDDDKADVLEEKKLDNNPDEDKMDEGDGKDGGSGADELENVAGDNAGAEEEEEDGPQDKKKPPPADILNDVEQSLDGDDTPQDDGPEEEQDGHEATKTDPLELPVRHLL